MKGPVHVAAALEHSTGASKLAAWRGKGEVWEQSWWGGKRKGSSLKGGQSQ